MPLPWQLVDPGGRLHVITSETELKMLCDTHPLLPTHRNMRQLVGLIHSCIGRDDILAAITILR